MIPLIDRKVYFDHVRRDPFNGVLTQQNVDGQNAILDRWEIDPATVDFRWLAYALATTMHETASTMWTVTEYGMGKGQPYGVPDPETKQIYAGRGFVQLTWRDNYKRATKELKLTGNDDLEWHADKALDLKIAGDVMFRGMIEGWFRTRDNKPETLPRYFNTTVDDPFNARGIINGDKNTIPKWSGGISIGKLIEGYHDAFLDALETSVLVA
jgi:hypothetical protein